MRLVVIGRTYGLNKTEIEKVAKAAFSYLNAEKLPGEIELKFVSKAVIQGLNSQYREIDRPTDVLSFLLTERPLVGQLFICYNYTVTQLKSTSRKDSDEVALLVTHGILHLFGYDHGDKESEQSMQEMERQILTKEGYIR